MTTIHNGGYIQKLCPLGEAHGIVSVLQLGVLGQLTAHRGHLRIHVHEKAIFCVLQEGRHEKCWAWRTNRREENEARPRGGLWGDKVTVPMMDQSEVGRHNHTAGPWILTHGEGVKEPLSWRNMCQERCKYDRAGSLTCPVDESIPTAIKTNVIFRLKLRPARLRSSFYGIILIFWCAKQKNVTDFACFCSLPQLWSFQSSGSARKCQRSPPQSSSLSPPCWVGYSSCHLDHMQTCNLQLM